MLAFCYLLVIVYFGAGLWAAMYISCCYYDKGRTLMGWQFKEIVLFWPVKALRYWRELRRGG